VLSDVSQEEAQDAARPCAQTQLELLAAVRFIDSKRPRDPPHGMLLAGVSDRAADHRELESAQVCTQRRVVLPVAPRHPQDVLRLWALVTDRDLQGMRQNDG
jgi:hypothetical protein